MSSINVIFSDQSIGDLVGVRSIFLAGPTPREMYHESWRTEALDILSTTGFTGTVFVPERQNWQTQFDYVDQIEWELQGLDTASVIAFWVPRNMTTMPALCTNVEFGRYVGRHPQVVYGRPPEAFSIRYLDYIYGKYDGKHGPFTTLQETLERAASLCV